MEKFLIVVLLLSIITTVVGLYAKYKGISVESSVETRLTNLEKKYFDPAEAKIQADVTADVTKAESYFKKL